MFVATVAVPPVDTEDRWRYPATRDGDRVVSWWVKDGSTKRIVTSLTADDRCRSIASVIGIATLRRALHTGWTPQSYNGNGPWQGPRNIAEYDDSPAQSEPRPRRVEHLVSFRDDQSAQEFAREAQRLGFEADAHESGNDEWSVVLTGPYVDNDAINLPAALQTSSERLGGMHDGSGLSRGS